MSRDPREAERKEAYVSFAVNTLVWAIRLVAGLLTGSYALIADSWHSMSDNMTSLVVYVSSKLASKPPDEQHPYGHGRVADIGTLMVGLMLVGIAAYIPYEALTKYLAGYYLIPEYASFGVATITLTALAKEGLARYAMRLAEETGSSLCKADGWHHRVDALTGLAILPVFVLEVLGIRSSAMDLVLAFAISGLVLYEGVNIAADSVNSLMDATRKEMVDEITGLVMRLKGVQEVHDVRVRSYGGNYFVELKIHVPPSMSVQEAHKLAELIEDEVKKKYRNVIEVLIHVEPSTPHR